jgi:general secretion pathway protein E
MFPQLGRTEVLAPPEPTAALFFHAYAGSGLGEMLIPLWTCGAVVIVGLRDSQIAPNCHPLIRAVSLSPAQFDELSRQVVGNASVSQDEQTNWRVPTTCPYPPDPATPFSTLIAHACLPRMEADFILPLARSGRLAQTDYTTFLSKTREALDAPFPLLKVSFCQSEFSEKEGCLLAEDDAHVFIGISRKFSQQEENRVYLHWRQILQGRALAYFNLIFTELSQPRPRGYAPAVHPEPLQVEEPVSDLVLNLSPHEPRSLNPRALDTDPQALLRWILREAVRHGASDLHFDYFHGAGRIRFRLDGFLVPQMNPPLEVQRALISQLKNLGRMPASDYSAQDGQFSLCLEGKLWNLRLAFIPHRREFPVLVVRLLPRSNPVPLSQYGLTQEQAGTWRQLVQRQQGLVLVTGPTGSGKTTFLFSTLAELDLTQKAVVTIEDPVEYEIEGLTQISLNPHHGITACSVLRTVVRMDPDVIFCGEIRDQETATLVIEAATTGHLVLSTLHAATAVEAVDRLLLNFRVDPLLLSQSLLGVTNHRLVPKLCPHCRKQEGSLYRANPEGCPHCLNGYRGRLPLLEILVNQPVVAEEILQGRGGRQLESIARGANCLRPLVEEGQRLRREGFIDESVLKQIPGYSPDE